jgi:hypothetical protein
MQRNVRYNEKGKYWPKEERKRDKTTYDSCAVEGIGEPGDLLPVAVAVVLQGLAAAAQQGDLRLQVAQLLLGLLDRLAVRDVDVLELVASGEERGGW